MVLVASRGRQLSYDVGGVGGQPGLSFVRRQWCWRLARVVSCRTTSVVLEASRGHTMSVVLVASRGHRWCWWLAGLLVVVPGISGWPPSSGLSAVVWAVVTQPAVVSGSSSHPVLTAPKL